MPEALACLKYFCEEAPDYHLVCAGSLLGVALHGGTSFPVGKVDFLELGPMTFAGFLEASGREQYAKAIAEGDHDLTSHFADTLVDALKQYFVTGGMPEVVRHYAENNDLMAARRLQASLLAAFEQDFSKHAPVQDVPRLRQIWTSIPTQLAKANRKFVYGLLRTGSRAKDYENALLWLCDCGLVRMVRRSSAPRPPLRAYEDMKAFKLYGLDLGLLGCMAGLSPAVLLDGDAVFVEFKGAITEQFVLQELQSAGLGTVGWWLNDAGTAEIDFLLEHAGRIIPLEVKASVNLKAKSLAVYRQKFNPEIAVRTSLAGFCQEDSGLLNLPLYAIASLGKYLA